MDTARFYAQSDRTVNRQFRRRWHEPSPPRPAPSPPPAAAEAEPGAATLLRWVDEWRTCRAARPRRQGAAR